jgi:NAD(P)-dependent dehydrogenase (short-subunit alcohol dehydrogenase family)
VRTELIRHLLDDEAMLSAYTKAIPMCRIAEPEEIGPLVAFLCSDLVLLRHNHCGGIGRGGIVWAQQGHRGTVGARA